jgi:hypothetical protein
MFRALLCKELKNRRWYIAGGLAVFSLVAVIVPTSYLGVFPYLQNIDFAMFVWGSWWGQGLWQMGFVFALLLGIGGLDPEGRGDVLEFLLSRNVTRCSILAAKMTADIAILWLVAAVSTLALTVAARSSGIEFTPPYSLINAAVFAGIAFLVPYTIAFLTVMITHNKLLGFFLGVCWVFIDITILVRLREGLSVLHYMATQDYYLTGGFPRVMALAVLAVAFLLAAITYYVFREKEI